MTTHPHVAAGELYARHVVSGKIDACKWVRLACARHLKDRKRTDWEFRFDAALAERKAQFLELFPHTKGKWAAQHQPYKLEPWQCFMVLSIFGWVYKSGEKKGKRRFRRALLMVPRKNGKSDFAARLGLALFADDGEFGAEIYSGATSEKQAWEVFRPAKLMAERTRAFQEHYGVGVMKSNLHIIANGSRFEPLIGNPGDGASPSGAIVDEYHEHNDDSLLDTMETGMSAREQPLTIIITTAGSNLAGPCYELLKALQAILEGSVENDHFWGIYYTIDMPDLKNDIKGDDWTTEAALRKANPNWGISVDPDHVRSKQREARRHASKQGTFLTKHCNVWVGARQAYFNSRSWLQNARSIRETDYYGKPLFVGLDLASTKDVAAAILLFELEAQTLKSNGLYAMFSRFYIPEAAIANGSNEHYAGWARDRVLIVTPGNMIDFGYIEEDLIKLNDACSIQSLAFDPWQSAMLATRLMAAAIPCVKVPQTVPYLSMPMKTLDGLILSGRILHNGDPCMTWMMGNVVGAQRPQDNVLPDKERPEAKIDGPVALIMALSRALTLTPEAEPDIFVV